jgi:hypothetical protein
MERAEQAPTEGSAHPSHEEVALEEIRAALRGIRFGSVLVKIHDGEIVGIETSTKVRFNNHS